jgi:hypothetical protein
MINENPKTPKPQNPILYGHVNLNNKNGCAILKDLNNNMHLFSCPAGTYASRMASRSS